MLTRMNIEGREEEGERGEGDESALYLDVQSAVAHMHHNLSSKL